MKPLNPPREYDLRGEGRAFIEEPSSRHRGIEIGRQKKSEEPAAEAPNAGFDERLGRLAAGPVGRIADSAVELFREFIPQEIAHPAVAVIGDIESGDGSASRFEGTRHPAISTSAFENTFTAQVDLLGKSFDRPGGGWIEIPILPRVARFMFAHWCNSHGRRGRIPVGGRFPYGDERGIIRSPRVPGDALRQPELVVGLRQQRF